MPDPEALRIARGVAMVIEKLPELAQAVNAALRKAIERGLIDDDGGEA